MRSFLSLSLFLGLALSAFGQSTASSTDVNHQFITLAIHGYQAEPGQLYADGDAYFHANGMSDLGPSGTGYTNISAYRLSDVATSSGADFVRQIGDFTIAADAPSFQRSIQNTETDGGRILGSNGQNFISMAKLEWTYRNTKEFMDNVIAINIASTSVSYIAGEELTNQADINIRKFIDSLISFGPRYQQLLAVGPGTLASDLTAKIQNQQETLASIGNNPVYTDQLHLDDIYGAPSWLTSSKKGKWNGTNLKSLEIALWLSAWQAPNVVRLMGHSMGGTDIMRYLSETYNPATFDPNHPVGLYQRNQDYDRLKFNQDKSLLFNSTNANDSIVVHSLRNLDDDQLYQVFKKERQNSVDKVIIVDSPLSGTPTTDLVETTEVVTSILTDFHSLIDFQNTVKAAVAVNVIVAAIEMAAGNALIGTGIGAVLGWVLVQDAFIQLGMDVLFFVAVMLLDWDFKTDHLWLAHLVDIPKATDPIPIKPSDRFFQDTKIHSSHVLSYTGAAPPTRFSNWDGLRSSDPVEIQNVVVAGPQSYTHSYQDWPMSTYESIFWSIATGSTQRYTVLALVTGRVFVDLYKILEIASAITTEPSNPNGASYTETVLPLLWFVLGVDAEPGTLVTTESYSRGVHNGDSYASGKSSDVPEIRPIAENPLASVYRLRATTAGWANNSAWYGAGFPARSGSDANTWLNQVEPPNPQDGKFLGIHDWDQRLLSFSILAKDSSRLLIQEQNGIIDTLSYDLSLLKDSTTSVSKDFPLEKQNLRGRSFYDYFMFGPQDQSTSRSIQLSTQARFGNVLAVTEDASGNPLKGLRSTYVSPANASVVGSRSYLTGLNSVIFNNVVQVMPVSIVNYFTGVTSAFSIDGADFVPGEDFQPTTLWPTLDALGIYYQNNPSSYARLVIDAASGRALLIGPHFKEGFNEVAFRITDQIGGVTMRDMQVMQITVPPFVKPVYPLMNQYVSGGTVHASVQALDIGGGSIKPSDWLQKANFDIKVDGQAVYGAIVSIVGDGGTVSFDIPGLTDGNHTIEFKVSTYGVENTQSWRFWVDSSAPIVTMGDPLIFSNADPINSGKVAAFVLDTVPFHLNGTDYPVDTVLLSSLDISVAGQSVYSANNVRLGNYIQPWNGWSGNFPLPTGRYPFTVTATDRVGNPSIQTGQVIVDNTPPVLQTASLNTHLVTLSTGLLSLDYQVGMDDWETAATLNLNLTNRSTNEKFTLATAVASQDEAQYTLTYFSQGVNNLRDGIYDITVTAVDPVGNQSAPQVFSGIIVDRTPPVLSNVYATPFELTTPQTHVDLFLTASEVNDANTNLSSILALDIKLTDTNGNAVASVPEYTAGIGSSSTTKIGFELPGLPDGKYLFQVSVTDTHGNLSVEYVPVIMNAVPPEFTLPAANAIIDGITALYGNISSPHFSTGLALDHYELYYQSGAQSLPANLASLAAQGWVDAGLTVPGYQTNPAWPKNWGRFPVQGGNILGSLDTGVVDDGLVTVLAVAIEVGGYRIGAVRTLRVLHGSLNETVSVQIPATSLSLDVSLSTPSTPVVSVPYTINHDLNNPVDLYTAIVDGSGHIIKQSTFRKLYSTDIIGRPSSMPNSGLYVFETSDGAFHMVFNNPGQSSFQQVVTVTGTGIHGVTDGQNAALMDVALSSDGSQLLLARTLLPGTSQEVVFQVAPGAAIEFLDATQAEGAAVYLGLNAQKRAPLTTLSLYQGSDYPSFTWDGADSLGRYVVNGTYTAIIEAYGELGGHDVKTIPIQLTTPFLVDQVTLDTHSIQLGVGALSVVNGAFHINKPASVQVLVFDAANKQIGSVSVPSSPLLNPGVAAFSWNATDSTGALVPVGTYSFQIVAVPSDTSTATTFDASAIPTLGNIQVSLGLQLDPTLPASLSIQGESTYQGAPVTSGSNQYSVQVTPTGQYVPDTSVTVGLAPKGTQIVQAFPQMNYMVALRKNYAELWSRIRVTHARIKAHYDQGNGGNWNDVAVDTNNVADVRLVSYDMTTVSHPTVTVAIAFSGKANISKGHWDSGWNGWIPWTNYFNFNGYDDQSMSDSDITVDLGNAYTGRIISSYYRNNSDGPSTYPWDPGIQSCTIRMTVVVQLFFSNPDPVGAYFSFADGIHVMGPDATIPADKTAYVDATSSRTYSIYSNDSQLSPSFTGNDALSTVWRRNPSYYFYYVGENYANVTDASSLKSNYGPGAENYSIGRQGQGAVGRINLATSNLVSSGIPPQIATNGKVQFVFDPGQGSFTVSSSAEDRILYPFPEANASTLTVPHSIGDANLGIPLLNINGQRSNATPNFVVPAVRLNSAAKNVNFADNSYNAVVTKPLLYQQGEGYGAAIPLSDINAAASIPASVNVKQWSVANVSDAQNKMTFTGLVGSTFLNSPGTTPAFNIVDSNIQSISSSSWNLTQDSNIGKPFLALPGQSPDLDSLNRYGRVKTLYFSDLYPLPVEPVSNPKGMFIVGSDGSEQDNPSVVIPGLRDYAHQGGAGGYTVSLLGIDGKGYAGLTPGVPATFGKGQKLSDGVNIILNEKAIRALLPIYGQATSTFDLSYLATTGNWVNIPVDSQDSVAGILSYWDVTGLSGIQTLRLISHGTSTANVVFTKVYIGNQVVDSPEGSSVVSTSGKAKVIFPPGSVSDPMVISVEAVDYQDVKDVAILPAYAPLGKIVKLGPEGTTFPNVKPLLQFTYNKADVDALGIDPLQLVIYQLKNDGTLVAVPSSLVYMKVTFDTNGNMISEAPVWDSSSQLPGQVQDLDYTYIRVFATLNHFSYYVLYEGDLNRRPLFDQTDFSTKNTKVVVTGMGQANSPIKLYVQNQSSINLSSPTLVPSKSTTTDASGVFSLADVGLPFEGDNYLFVAYGNGTGGQYSKLKATRDTAPPILATGSYQPYLSPNGDGVQDDTSIPVSSSEDGKIRWQLADGHGQGVLNGTGSLTGGVGFSIRIAGTGATGQVLNNGSFTLTMIATDAVGNDSPPQTIPLYLDTAQPQMSVNILTSQFSPANQDGFADKASFTFELTKQSSVSLWLGNGNNPKAIQLLDSAESPTGVSTLTWNGKSAEAFVADDKYFVTARIVDLFGNINVATFSQAPIQVVNTPPSVQVTIGYNNSFVIPAGAHFTLGLDKAATVELKVTNSQGDVALDRTSSMAAGTNSVWWDTRALTQGHYSMSVTATDDLGNTMTPPPLDVFLRANADPPTILLKDEIMLEATDVNTPFTLPEPAVIDEVAPIALANDAPVAYPLGTTVVNWKASDPYGISSTKAQKVTVRDTTPPMFTMVSPPIVVETTSVHTFVDVGSLQSGAVSVYDIFPVSVVNDSPGEFFQGTTIVTWTATDVNGNVAQAVQNVIVQRPQNDTFTGPWYHEDLGNVLGGGAQYDGTTFTAKGTGRGVFAPNQTQSIVRVESQSSSGYSGKVIIHNISGSVIHGWVLGFVLPLDTLVIVSPNGKIDDHEVRVSGGVVKIRGRYDDSDIPVNGSIEVGFRTKGLGLPSAITLNAVPAEDGQNSLLPTPNQTTVSISKSADKGSGYDGLLTVANVSNAPIQGWNLTFQFPGTEHITRVDGGSYVQTGNSVTLKNGDRNGTIGVMESISIRFRVQGSELPETGLLFNGITSLDSGSIDDQVHFLYQKVSGDASITLKVGPFAPGDTGAQAVVMLRDSLTPQSKMVAISANVVQGADHHSRSKTEVVTSWRNGSSTGVLVAKPASDDWRGEQPPMPLYLRLTRLNHRILVFSSTDGIHWGQVGEPMSVSTSGSDYLGVGVRNFPKGSTIPISDATVTIAYPSSGVLSNGWVHQDIGLVDQPGWATLDGSNVTEQGNGSGSLEPNLTRLLMAQDLVTHDGYIGHIRLTNVSPQTIVGWELAFSFPGSEKIVRLWNGSFVQDGTKVIVQNANHNQRIDPNGTVEIGFQVIGVNIPIAVTLNGVPCVTEDLSQSLHPANSTTNGIVLESQYSNRYNASLKLRNVSATSIKSWSLSFDFSGNERVQNIEGYHFSQNGSHVVVESSDPVGEWEPGGTLELALAVIGRQLPGNVLVNGVPSLTAALFPDSYHAVLTPGAGDITLRGSFDPSQVTPGSQILLTIRRQMTADSPMVSLFVTRIGQELRVYFGYRSNVAGYLGDPLVLSKNGLDPPGPVSLKLVGKGNVLTAFESIDGVNWNSVGTNYTGFPLNSYYSGIGANIRLGKPDSKYLITGVNTTKE